MTEDWKFMSANKIDSSLTAYSMTTSFSKYVYF